MCLTSYVHDSLVPHWIYLSREVSSYLQKVKFSQPFVHTCKTHSYRDQHKYISEKLSISETEKLKQLKQATASSLTLEGKWGRGILCECFVFFTEWVLSWVLCGSNKLELQCDHNDKFKWVSLFQANKLPGNSVLWRVWLVSQCMVLLCKY